MLWTLDTPEDWASYQESMEDLSPGFWDRWRPRILTVPATRFVPFKRYQFGYQMRSEGNVVGHCRHHRAHWTIEGAQKCRDRFLAGEPDTQWNKLPLMRVEHI